MTRIAVDPGRVTGHLDRNVFGGFIEHLGRCIYGGIYDEGSPAADASGRAPVRGLGDSRCLHRHAHPPPAVVHRRRGGNDQPLNGTVAVAVAVLARRAATRQRH